MRQKAFASHMLGSERSRRQSLDKPNLLFNLYSSMKNNTSPSREPEGWINTAKACEYLSISTATIRRWIKDGKLRARRTPTGELRFRRSELDLVFQ